jgi:hypothetical protein
MSVQLPVDHFTELGPPKLCRQIDRGVAWSSIGRILCQLLLAGLLSILSPVRAEIPWPEVVQRLAQENERLANRPQGHAGDYFVVCTIYYTPMESGFTGQRGFDVTLETRPGLHGHKYPREFLEAVKKEGFGRIITSVGGCSYIHYEGGNSFAFATHPAGRAGDLAPRRSAAAHRGQRAFSLRTTLAIAADSVRQVFGRTNWKIADTGKALQRWQIDLYWGEDEPLGPGKMLARPRGTEFEYAYSEIKITKTTRN